MQDEIQPDDQLCGKRKLSNDSGLSIVKRQKHTPKDITEGNDQSEDIKIKKSESSEEHSSFNVVSQVEIQPRPEGTSENEDEQLEAKPRLEAVELASLSQGVYSRPSRYDTDPLGSYIILLSKVFFHIIRSSESNI